MFKYGGFKLFLFKIFSGLILLVFGIFLAISLWTHNPSDPGLGKLKSFGSVGNFFGYFGALASSSLLFLFGLFSYVMSLFFSYFGLLLFLGFVIKKFFFKFFLILISSVFFNQIFASIYLNQSETGIIYQGLKILVQNLFRDYNFYFLEGRASYFVFLMFSFLALIITLFYVFNIKLKYLTRVRIIEPIITFFYKKIIALVTFSFSFFKRDKIKNTEILKRNKSEPVLHKNKSLTKNYKPKETKQINDIDNYYYTLPSIDLFSQTLVKKNQTKENRRLNEELSLKLENTLLEYGVEGKIVSFKSGPIVTLFEFVPKAGTKASKVVGLSDDIAREMSSLSSRISSQPGKTSLGIEIPNSKREGVLFGDLINDEGFWKQITH